MFISTIIPTVNRPSLSRAVHSVLGQDFPKDNFEVIVVNDSGHPLPEADWLQSSQVRVIETNRRERSFARNAGAAISKGEYLHFLDDDDWMLSGAFSALWELSRQSQAAWLYGAFRFVDDAGVFMKEVALNMTGNCFVQLMAGEWVPLSASFIKTGLFFSVGGFVSLPSFVYVEDADLARMISHDFAFAFTPATVVAIRRGESLSTTDYSHIFDQLRQSREKALDLPGSFSRMRTSANEAGQDSAYWNGYVVYFYLASMFHNVFRKKRVFTALSRGAYSIAALLLAGTHIFKSGFWRGVREKYLSPSFR